MKTMFPLASGAAAVALAVAGFSASPAAAQNAPAGYVEYPAGYCSPLNAENSDVCCKVVNKEQLLSDDELALCASGADWPGSDDATPNTAAGVVGTETPVATNPDTPGSGTPDDGPATTGSVQSNSGAGNGGETGESETGASDSDPGNSGDNNSAPGNPPGQTN